MECVAYMRVSTEKQAEEGYGLDSQKRDIQDYCRKNELIISEWYIDDGYSGKNIDRPMIQRLITDCGKNRVKCVVTFALDRIARSTYDTIYILERVFQKNNVELRCVHNTVHYETPSEQFQTQIIAAVAEYERKNIVLRMRGGMLERIKQGYWRGGGNLPYCYYYDKDDGILKVIPERKEQANKAIQMFIEGHSDESILKTLGFRNEITVRNLLTSVVNIGMIPYKGKLYQGRHEPIFDRETFEFAQQVRATRRNARAYSRTETNLLTGLCYCGVCGCKMRYQKWTHGKHKLYCYSRNSTMKFIPNYNHDCNNTMEWASDIEEQVENEILKISVSLSDYSPTSKQSKIEIIENRIEKESSKLKRLYSLYAEGNDTVLDMVKKQEHDIERLKAELTTERLAEKKEPKKDFVFGEMKKLADVWEHIDKQKRNSLLKIIISKIVIVNGNIEIILNDF